MKTTRTVFLLGAAIIATLFTTTVFAQDTIIEAPAIEDGVLGMSKEAAFVVNSFMFLMAGTLVMWMAAGFTMLEAGLVRAQNNRLRYFHSRRPGKKMPGFLPGDMCSLKDIYY